MECENEVPMNHTDLAVAGYPRLDSRCWLKVWKHIFKIWKLKKKRLFQCKEGFHFKEHAGSTGFEVPEDVPDGRFEMKCVQDWDHR